MSAVFKETGLQAQADSMPPVVVVGTGPVGVCFVEELLKRDPEAPVVIYGNEPWEPYNRVRLAGLLTGELNLASIQNVIRQNKEHQVVQHHNCEIVAIDTELKKVYDKFGNEQVYSKLVLATGSKPHIPNIEGIDKAGVYTFRDMNDVQKLVARRVRSRRVVVLGGGLLGLEAARGLQKYNTDVTVVEHSTHLMSQQLDEEAGELLREHMLLKRVHIVLKDAVKKVVGDSKIKAIKLNSGRIFECDTLVVAAGIKPNIQLALDAGIAVGRGIRVDDQMQTNKEGVYAIGECAEHREKVYGLVAPGLEQASVAAYSVTGGKSNFKGSQTVTRLKVAGVSVFSAGLTSEHEINSQLRRISWSDKSGSSYRKLIFNRSRLVGVIAYGEWSETQRIQDMVSSKRFVWPWQIKTFRSEGSLWKDSDNNCVSAWPSSAIICQCKSVDRGTLSNAISAGCSSIEALREETGASSVCGSCKPLLAEMVGEKTIEKEQGSRTLIWTAGMTIALASLILLAPSIPFSETVQKSLQVDILWRDGLLKQITGFSLLAAAVLVSLITIRKRIKSVTLGAFSKWRVLHVIIGVTTIAALVGHTGMRLGNNLNFYLMICFMGIVLAGGIASGAIGLQHVIPRGTGKLLREMSMWAHIMLLWPLPVLLGFHIFKSYWF